MKLYIVDGYESQINSIVGVIQQEGIHVKFFRRLRDLQTYIAQDMEKLLPSLIMCSYDSVDFEYDDLSVLSSAPSIFFGDESKEKNMKALMSGAVDYMHTPIDAEILICKVRAFHEVKPLYQK